MDEDDYGNSLAIDSLGRLVVAGDSYNVTDYDFALARYKEMNIKSSGGGCNLSSLPALGFLLAIPLMLLSKRGR